MAKIASATLLILTCFAMMACQTIASVGRSPSAEPVRSDARFGLVDLYAVDIYEGETAAALLEDPIRSTEPGWKLVVAEVAVVNTAAQPVYVALDCFECEQEVLDSEGFPHSARVERAKDHYWQDDLAMLPHRGFKAAFYVISVIPEAYEPAAIRFSGFCTRTDTFVWRNDSNHSTPVTLDLANRVPADLYSPVAEQAMGVGPVEGFTSVDVSVKDISRGTVCIVLKNRGGENMRAAAALTSAYDHSGYLLHDEEVEIIDIYDDSAELPPGAEKTYCIPIQGATSPGWQQISLYTRFKSGIVNQELHTRTYWFHID